ncbi:MAG: sugar kinase [Pseudomonadota bacterium]
MSDPFSFIQKLDRPARVACVGECMVELSGVDIVSGTGSVGVAGDTLNTAIYLRRLLGQDAAEIDYLTALGTDAYSDAIMRFITDEGLGTDGIVRFDDRLPGVYAIHVNEEGERSFLYWRNQSAARSMFDADGLTQARLLEYDVVYLSGITLAILSRPARHLLVRAASSLTAAGKLVAFDSNFRPKLWESGDDARASMDGMWSATSVGLPSSDDEEAMWQMGDPNRLMQRLVRRGVREIAMKDGARGPRLWNGAPLNRSAYGSVEAVDTTAAGDAFNAGYLAARIAGRSETQAGQIAHSLASSVVMHPGAIIPQAAMPAGLL